jgi:hypothetical protein
MMHHTHTPLHNMQYWNTFAAKEMLSAAIIAAELATKLNGSANTAAASELTNSLFTGPTASMSCFSGCTVKLYILPRYV